MTPPTWNDLERFLLDRHNDTGDPRYQDAATVMYQARTGWGAPKWEVRIARFVYLLWNQQDPYDIELVGIFRTPEAAMHAADRILPDLNWKPWVADCNGPGYWLADDREWRIEREEVQ